MMQRETKEPREEDAFKRIYYYREVLKYQTKGDGTLLHNKVLRITIAKTTAVRQRLGSVLVLYYRYADCTVPPVRYLPELVEELNSLGSFLPLLLNIPQFQQALTEIGDLKLFSKTIKDLTNGLGKLAPGLQAPKWSHGELKLRLLLPKFVSMIRICYRSLNYAITTINKSMELHMRTTDHSLMIL